MNKRDKAKADYHRVHQWLRYWYGSANKCENSGCEGKSKSYTWALKKGKSYKKNKDNFMQLCCSCHNQYDSTNKMKKVYQYSLNGDIVNIYPSTRSTKKDGFEPKTISYSCNKPSVTSKGFIWSYTRLTKKQVKERLSINRKRRHLLALLPNTSTEE